MKIDPSGKQQPIVSTPTVQPKDKTGDGGRFAEVLNKTVQHSLGTAEGQANGVRPQAPSAPIMPMAIQPPVSQGRESDTIHGLLNALEAYQQQLGDPEVNLKMVATSVDHMATLSKKAQPLLGQMPESHPMKAVAKEAMMTISKEVERFNSGYYVDH